MLRVALNGSLGGFTLDADFAVTGGSTALFGRSGAGKSLILRGICGLWTPQRGRVEFDGQVLLDTESGVNVAAHRRNFGVVFQHPNLFPHLSVERNLRYGMPDPEGRIDEVVSVLDIGHLTGRYPRHLSGGEAQRVALGRALLSAPRMLLLDEPLTGLDDARRAEIIGYLNRLQDEFDLPMLCVSHNRDEIFSLAETVVGVENGRTTAPMNVEKFRHGQTH